MVGEEKKREGHEEAVLVARGATRVILDLREKNLELEARIAAAEEWTFKPEMPMDLAELVRILRGEGS